MRTTVFGRDSYLRLAKLTVKAQRFRPSHQDLEINKLVKRTVFDTKPVTVEYRLTEHGKSLEKTIQELANWGVLHRKKIFGKKASELPPRVSAGR